MNARNYLSKNYSTKSIELFTQERQGIISAGVAIKPLW